MLSWLGMMNNYEQRKVARHEDPAGWIVDTCSVTDSDQPYETAIVLPLAGGDTTTIVVETYDTREESETGHARWVSQMQTRPLTPDDVVDVGTSFMAKLAHALEDLSED